MPDTDNLYEENIKQLREKTEQEMLQLEFKKRLLGGINQREVISYVNSIREQAQRAEETFKKRIGELTESRENLRADYRSMKEQLNEATRKLSANESNIGRMEQEKLSQQVGMNSRINDLITENNRLSGELKEMEQTVKNLQDKMLQMENERQSESSDDARLVEMTKMLYDQKKLCLDQEQQIKRDEVRLSKLANEKAELEKVVIAMKEDVSRNYSQLEEQIKANHKQAIQLENERIRSANAVKSRAETEETLYAMHDINSRYKEEAVRINEEIAVKYIEVEDAISSQIKEIAYNFKSLRDEIEERSTKLKDLTLKAEQDIGNIMETIEQNYKKDNIIDLPKYKQG